MAVAPHELQDLPEYKAGSIEEMMQMPCIETTTEPKVSVFRAILRVC
ncbi:hypothetical protein ACSAZL_14400 [Methanosarcina sp. T3]